MVGEDDDGGWLSRRMVSSGDGGWWLKMSVVLFAGGVCGRQFGSVKMMEGDGIMPLVH